MIGKKERRVGTFRLELRGKQVKRQEGLDGAPARGAVFSDALLASLPGIFASVLALTPDGSARSRNPVAVLMGSSDENFSPRRVDHAQVE